jgi:DNA recombination protein RmuC
MILWAFGGVLFLLLLAGLVIIGARYQRLKIDYSQISVDYSNLQRFCEQEKSESARHIRFFEQMHQHWNTTLQSTLHDALFKNTEHFLTLAHQSISQLHQTTQTDLEIKKDSFDQIAQPLQKAFMEVNDRLKVLEKDRLEAQGDLRRYLQELVVTQKELRVETAHLTQALRTPVVRGQWGEMQLKRVVELAGMLDHCDFQLQKTSPESPMRPDMIVYLPGKKQVVVDAKTPLSAYLEAVETVDSVRKQAHLEDHARQVRTHIRLLSQKSYWDQFPQTPEFVVLFLPSEAFFSAALEQDPSLIEVGVKERVILATPTTLIALLRAIAYGWRQENLAENTQKISTLASELVRRLSDLSAHLKRMGKALETTVEVYNQSVGSYERRLLSTARKFEQLDPHLKISEEISQIHPSIRSVASSIPNTPEIFTNPEKNLFPTEE